MNKFFTRFGGKIKPFMNKLNVLFKKEGEK